jgi:hypothetical protein
MRAVNALIVAIASALPDGLPDEIVYIPEGENLIYPSSHPKGITVKLAAARPASPLPPHHQPASVD